MALDPLEWIIIGVIVVVIFLWGPTKIPALARALDYPDPESWSNAGPA